jgi:hypothetical protein
MSLDLYRKYTQPEELIQSNNPDMISKARNITEGENDVEGKVVQIYRFVVSHVNYVAQDRERGALWALKNATGDCSEFSYLFIALCRAVGIPARVQAGYAFSGHRNIVEDGHMWAEYYLENYGWVPVDATWRFFNALDEMHFSSMRGIPENIPYSSFFFDYARGPDPEKVEEDQRLTVEAKSTRLSNDSATNRVAKAVGEMNSARLMLMFGKMAGISIIFPSGAAEAGDAFLSGELRLQTAIENLENNPRTAALYASRASEYAETAIQKTLVLIVYDTMVIAAILVLVLGGIFLLSTKHKREITRLKVREQSVAR